MCQFLVENVKGHGYQASKKILKMMCAGVYLRLAAYAQAASPTVH